MKNFKQILSFGFIILVCFAVCGCDKKQNNTSGQSYTMSQTSSVDTETISTEKEKNTSEIDTDNTNDLQYQIDSLNKIVNELSESNKNAESNINALKKQIESLKSENTALKENIKTITNNTESSGGKYTITKEELLGEWNCLQLNDTITFADDNVKIIDNWIIWEDRFYQYAFIEGKLYISDDGYIFEK